MAITLADYEELNSMKSLPYTTYFGDMGLTSDSKETRREMARQFEDLFLLVFAMMDYQYTQPNLVLMVTQRYLDIVRRFHATDAYINEYVAGISAEIVRATFDHQNEPYFTSYDRARYIAENETNTVMNHLDFEDAKAEGAEEKTWLTMLDERVRPTHWEIDGMTVPIDEPFPVGISLMMYPKDSSLGAAANEIIGCRCWVVYS